MLSLNRRVPPAVDALRSLDGAQTWHTAGDHARAHAEDDVLVVPALLHHFAGRAVVVLLLAAAVEEDGWARAGVTGGVWVDARFILGEGDVAGGGAAVGHWDDAHGGFVDGIEFRWDGVVEGGRKK